MKIILDYSLNEYCRLLLVEMVCTRRFHSQCTDSFLEMEDIRGLKDWSLESNMLTSEGILEESFLGSVKTGLIPAVCRIANVKISKSFEISKDLNVPAIVSDCIPRSNHFRQKKELLLSLSLLSHGGFVDTAHEIDCSDNLDRLLEFRMYKRAKGNEGMVSRSPLLHLLRKAREMRCFAYSKRCLDMLDVDDHDAKFLLEKSKLQHALGDIECESSLLKVFDLKESDSTAYSEACMFAYVIMKGDTRFSRLGIESDMQSFLSSNWTAEYYLQQASKENVQAHMKLANLYYNLVRDPSIERENSKVCPTIVDFRRL